MMTPALNQLPLAPLGAGDLIDRAVRLYRRHLFTLIRSSPIDSDLSVGDEKSLLGIFSVNLKKAIGAAGDADSKENAHAVREAVEFFVYGVSQKGPVNKCGGH